MKISITKILFHVLLTVLFYPSNVTAAADSSFIETAITLKTTTGDIFGTITLPKKFTTIPVVLIIAGSGPTDRNGNNNFMKNDGLKQLAFALSAENIASLRFDKRGIGESTKAGPKEEDLRFDDYVNDVKAWIDVLKKDKRFSSVIVIGHSEGSLIGMIVAKNADKYISIAGAGQTADVILRQQLVTLPEELRDQSFSILDSLKKGQPYQNVNPQLNMVFRKSVQPYMISWFKFDPQLLIKELHIPVLIIQGTADLQVKMEDADMLAKANPAAKLDIIENMNHVLKIVGDDSKLNMQSYNNPSLPIATELVKSIVDFIKLKK